MLSAPRQDLAAEARLTWGGELGGFGKATIVLIIGAGELVETGGHHFFEWWGRVLSLHMDLRSVKQCFQDLLAVFQQDIFVLLPLRCRMRKFFHLLCLCFLPCTRPNCTFSS